jgi:hypothetical protein
MSSRKSDAVVVGRALLVTVSGDSFDFAERPTPACAKRIEDAEEAFRRRWRGYNEES